jgi:hypothetical protein
MGPLTGTDSELVESRVAVHAIDYQNRRITLRNSQGLLETYTVAPEVKRLNEIKPEDRIVATYLKAVAFEVREPTAFERANPTLAGAALKKQPVDLPPGMEAAAVKHTIVTVDAIDFKRKSVTLATPEGETFTAYARYPDNLYRINVGDKVAVTYGEATIVNIVPQT